MAIADELKKIIAAKADIKAAIIEKGVDVPSDAPFSTWPKLVLKIKDSSYTFSACGSESPDPTPIEEELSTLQCTKRHLAEAIAACGVEVGDVPFSEYGDKIRQIETEPNPGEWGILYYMDGGEEVALKLGAQADFNALGNSTSIGGSITVAGQKIVKNNIVGFTFGTAPTSLPEYFLAKTHLERIDKIENYKGSAISNRFLSGCTYFNSPISLPSTITSIGNYFFENCSAFNQPFALPNSVTSIGNSFFRQCTAFNKRLDLSSSLRSIGGSFLAYCSSFNQPLVLPNSVQTIDSSFLGEASKFNQTITFSEQLRTIGDNFLEYAVSFNQAISLPNSVLSIKEGFLKNCAAFNSTITLPSSITSIGRNFLLSATSFTQPLSLPGSITNLEGGFMRNCDSFTGPLNVGEASGFEDDYTTLSTSVSTAPMYTVGVTLTGKNASGWKMVLPDSNVNPYRKVIVV